MLIDELASKTSDPDHIVPEEFMLSDGHASKSMYTRHSWYGSKIPNARWTLAYVKRQPPGSGNTFTPSLTDLGLILHLDFNCCQMTNPHPLMIHEKHVGKQRWCTNCAFMQGAIYGSVGRPAVPPGNRQDKWQYSLPCTVEVMRAD